MHKVEKVVANKIEEGAQKQYAAAGKDKEMGYSRVKFFRVEIPGGKILQGKTSARASSPSRQGTLQGKLSMSQAISDTKEFLVQYALNYPGTDKCPESLTQLVKPVTRST
ncbi:hypothetical protein ES703_87923 [subsurface metagenome]